MKLENLLSDYEEHTFLALFNAIWGIESLRAEHNELIAHFDQIVSHPAGSDLLFYSNADETGNTNSPEHIVATVKAWHHQNGRAAFKGQPLQPPPVRQTLTREQRATQSSTRNLEKVRKLVADIHSCEQESEQKLAPLEHQLTLAGAAPAQELTASVEALRALVLAQHQAKRAVDQLQRLQMSVKFAFEGAHRDVANSFLDSAIQAVVLQEITVGSQRHAVALAAAQARHPALYARGVTLIESLEGRIAQLAKASASGPGHGALTLMASAQTASLHPALLTAQGLSREVAQQQHHLNKTFRSAVAELEWQAASLEGSHPGSFADVAEFVLSTPSDDPRFAFTVPLVELFDSEPQDWVALAQARAEIALPMRLCSTVRGANGATSTGVKPFTRYSHVVMTLTQGGVVPSRVKVRSADWNAMQQAYVFTSEGDSPVTVVWQNGSAPYAPRDLARPPSIGFFRMPRVPLIAPFENLAQVQFDDYIVVFPPASGMAPLYLMFRDRREL
ncbi:S-type pyocin domain-containing protein [Pseudomonas capeferrum]|uniref:S-type pyocin domain-containing protein n=1 Tax=Pseudomonas capeferrum TaxID=1495066 RepID=UPI00397DA1D3